MNWSRAADPPGAPAPAPVPAASDSTAAGGLRSFGRVRAQRDIVALEIVRRYPGKLARRLARSPRQGLVRQQRPQQIGRPDAACTCSTDASNQGCLTISTMSGESAGARALPISCGRESAGDPPAGRPGRSPTVAAPRRNPYRCDRASRSPYARSRRLVGPQGGETGRGIEGFRQVSFSRPMSGSVRWRARAPHCGLDIDGVSIAMVAQFTCRTRSRRECVMAKLVAGTPNRGRRTRTRVWCWPVLTLRQMAP